MPKTFRVEYIFEPEGRAIHILLRQLSDDPFAITEDSTIAGARVHKWLEQPRRIKDDGTVDLDVFTIALRDPADRSRIQIGEEVLLLP